MPCKTRSCDYLVNDCYDSINNVGSQVENAQTSYYSEMVAPLWSAYSGVRQNCLTQPILLQMAIFRQLTLFLGPEIKTHGRDLTDYAKNQ